MSYVLIEQNLEEEDEPRFITEKQYIPTSIYGK